MVQPRSVAETASLVEGRSPRSGIGVALESRTNVGDPTDRLAASRLDTDVG
jgi:hypothetical protein